MPENVLSTLFVGREEERKTLEEFVSPESSQQILCIHSDGKGGLGKTQLLLRAHDAYNEKKGIIVVGKLIDFYLPEMKRKVGIIEELSKQATLSESLKLIEEYRKAKRLSGDEKAIKEIFEKFSEEFRQFASRHQEKVIVVIFDSYEHIQEVSETGVQSTVHSQWIEQELIPKLLCAKNMRVIIAGRYLPYQLGAYQPVKLQPFDQSTSQDFLKECLEKQGTIADEVLGELHRLAEGHPILLALAVDWIRHSNKSPRKLLSNVTPGKAFEKRLIEHIRQQIDESFALLKYIAIAYLRLNSNILNDLTGETVQACKDYIEKIRDWSFIKPKGDDTVILHDVMRSLLDEHVLSEDELFRQENTELLIKYYEKKLFLEDGKSLSESEPEQYVLELVEYGFQANFDQGVERFCKIFDQAMENGKYDFAINFLFRAAEERKIRHQGTFETLDFLKIEARRIEYDTETYSDHQGGLDRAEKIIQTYQDDPRWQDSEVQGIILLKKGTALFGLVRFEKAIKAFEEAHRLLMDNGDSLNAHWATNWKGYSYYQLGNFVEAEKFLDTSRKGFYGLIGKLLRKTESWDAQKKNEYRQLLQGFQITLVNLALVYLHTGRLYEAIHHARVFLHIVQNLTRNDREIARAKETLALTSWFIGYRLEAKLYLEEALKQADNDPLLTNRIRIGQLRHRFHESELLYTTFLEYYRAEEFKKEQLKSSMSLGQDESEAIIADLEKLGTTKELLTAYLVQANLYLLKVPVLFETIENILRKGLQEESVVKGQDRLRYEEVRSLENLVRLCYFATAWAKDNSSAQKLAEKLETYKQQFEKITRDLTQKGILYPELSARYHIVLGNVAFDKMMEQLEKTSSLDPLKEAIGHYLTAASLLKDFNVFRHHTFQIIRERLTTFIQAATNKNPNLLNNYSEIRDIPISDQEVKTYFSTVFKSTILCLPSTSREEIDRSADNLEKDIYEGSIAKKVVQTKSLVEALEILKEKEPIATKKYLQFQSAVWLMRKARLYRRLHIGRIEFVKRAFDKVEPVLQELEKSFGNESAEVLTLKGRLYAGRGTMYYRQGSYEELLEFYIRGELAEVRHLFGQHFEDAFEKAEELLLEGKKQLEQAQELWQQRVAADETSHVEIAPLYQMNTQWLGTAYFRIGELKMLLEKFEGEEGSLSYLEKAIKTCKKSHNSYRYLDAMESYITAVYFGDSSDKHSDQCKEYQCEIEKHKDKREFSLILAKLRITQGGQIFSEFFEYDEGKSQQKGVYQDVRYRLRDQYKPKDHSNELSPELQKSIRKMIRCYVEACDFMKATESPRNFIFTVRILTRRIRMLLDASVIGEISSVLPEIWHGYPRLEKRQEELTMLVQFSRILEGLTKK